MARHMKRNYQLKLKLWEKVIFVDWHGVISTDPFWQSITKNENHPLINQLKQACEKLFNNENDVLWPWMRGEFQANQIIDMMNIQLDRRFLKDFLSRRLISDCKKMVCNKELISFLEKIRQKAFVVLATDNMDCFLDAFQISQKYYRTKFSDETTLRTIASHFDEILCSANLGVLKSENSEKFFGTWLSWHDLSFENSLLLDDREDNLVSFEKLGGKGVLYKQKEKDSYEKAFEIVRAWIEKE
jgi:hypothetical protein